MTPHHSERNAWAKRHRKALTARHTHEDVLTDREFELLLEACSELPSPRAFQARFICLIAGRLGLRAGEIAHFDTTWLDWDRMLIRIPQYEPCACGYCRRQSIQEATRNDELTEEEALEVRWHPKTIASARAIPFDLSLRLELCIERFTNRYDSFSHSRLTINRRVQEAANQANLNGRVYPHCLRATAASYHAYKGVAPVPLQALMGWSDLATAQKYIRISGTATADALRQVHHR
ncbi:Phage integrase family protein [Halogranum amylolyticum]|uniref:Phage integrase family protein n=1 Tax=Halogranum amylolyticum TaxID=660520 RepID=A0A1H8WFK6_9EURY|nr:Phage integrase family protein [Halogranum amylolyticum]